MKRPPDLTVDLGPGEDDGAWWVCASFTLPLVGVTESESYRLDSFGPFKREATCARFIEENTDAITAEIRVLIDWRLS